MKHFYQYGVPLFLLVLLAACTKMANPVPPTAPSLPLQATLITIPSELDFSRALVQRLRDSGVPIVSIQSSTYMSLFPSTGKAVWIETSKGVVEGVFFDSAAEVKQIHIVEPYPQTQGRYRYTIQVPAPTLIHDQLLDAAYPLYFTAKDNMFLITNSEELDKALKRMYARK